MKIKVGDSHELYAGLAAIDQGDVKLAGKVRLAIAINLNRLKDVVTAYERTRAKMAADIQAEAVGALGATDATSASAVAMRDPRTQNQILSADSDLREAEQEVDLTLIGAEDLKLDENTTIRARVLSQIWPVLKVEA